MNSAMNIEDLERSQKLEITESVIVMLNGILSSVDLLEEFNSENNSHFDKSDKYVRYDLGKRQESIICKHIKGFSTVKSKIGDGYTTLIDKIYGDIFIDRFGFVDLKVGDDSLIGSISVDSLSCFRGWYLCLNKYCNKLYFIYSDYFRKYIKENNIRSTHIDYFGETDIMNFDESFWNNKQAIKLELKFS